MTWRVAPMLGSIALLLAACVTSEHTEAQGDSESNLITPASTGIAVLSSTAERPLASASLWRWPASPKPVTSVAARTPADTAIRPASLLRRTIDSTAAV